MARVFTAKAAKDYPNHGIKKGDTYYYWSPGFRGVKQMSATPPRPSQLTTSKMSGALAAGEALQDAINDASCVEDITSAMDEAIESIRSVAEEYEEASQAETSNGNRVPNADEMEEKAQGLNDWADSIESDKGEVESLDATDYEDEVDVKDLDEEYVEEVNGEKQRKPVTCFEELTPDEQTNMLDAAKELAQQNVDCPL
jgi:type VII secretion effector (TIGR04197 family)